MIADPFATLYWMLVRWGKIFHFAHPIVKLQKRLKPDLNHRNIQFIMKRGIEIISGMREMQSALKMDNMHKRQTEIFEIT